MSIEINKNVQDFVKYHQSYYEFPRIIQHSSNVLDIALQKSQISKSKQVLEMYQMFKIPKELPRELKLPRLKEPHKKILNEQAFIKYFETKDQATKPSEKRNSRRIKSNLREYQEMLKKTGIKKGKRKEGNQNTYIKQIIGEIMVNSKQKNSNKQSPKVYFEQLHQNTFNQINTRDNPDIGQNSTTNLQVSFFQLSQNVITLNKKLTIQEKRFQQKLQKTRKNNKFQKTLESYNNMNKIIMSCDDYLKQKSQYLIQKSGDQLYSLHTQ